MMPQFPFIMAASLTFMGAAVTSIYCDYILLPLKFSLLSVWLRIYLPLPCMRVGLNTCLVEVTCHCYFEAGLNVS